MPQTSASDLRQRVEGGSPGGWPPLQRGVSCGAVASQVKGNTGHVEKNFQKYLGNSKRAGVGT